MSLPIVSRQRLAKGVLALVALGGLLLSLPALADSQARIVRLSDVEGTIRIDRNVGQGYEKAFLNMPITAGTKIWAKEDGRAEVEFEDGSILHIVPDTKVSFSALSMRDSGGKLTTVDVEKGTAYLSYLGKGEDEFTVNFGHESATLAKAAHFRIDLNDQESELSVFKGELEVRGPAGSVQVEKDHSVTFDLNDDDRYKLASDIEPGPYDEWDKQQVQYHERDYNAKANGPSIPYGYGVSDLNFYGNYYSVPGYGYFWQPYFANMAWDPFGDGAWMWYPGFGYAFVSAYPWGWMPYRYGSWEFVPGFGWGWQPGGFSSWQPVPAVNNPPQRTGLPQPPTAPGHGTVVVGRGPVVPVVGGPPRRIMISQGSAGLGVPRGAVSDLAKASRQVSEKGSTTIHTSSSFRSAMTPPMTFGSFGIPARGGITSHSSFAAHSGFGASGGHGSSGAHMSTGSHMSMSSHSSSSSASHSSSSSSSHH